ncbi:MAG TPA: hypothetical protein PLR86_10535, partial [Planctomycetota bacterium]|nr:hypothetical protein [Planctomycetota bacterium]
QAGSSYDSHSTWKIDLQNLDIYGGSITAHSNYTPWDQNGYGGILYVKGAINTISLSYVTMQKTKSTGHGAAIYSEASNTSSITLTTSTIKDNSSQSSGGAIYNYASQNASIILQENSVLTNNTAKISGGGIYNQSITSTVTILESEISNNVVSSNSNNVYGGGVYNYGSTTATVDVDNNTLFHANQAIATNTTDTSYNAYGGGIFNQSPLNGNVNITNDSVFSSNKALAINKGEGHGGAIANYVSGNNVKSTGIITGFDSLIKDNEATTNGGGLYNYVYNNAYGTLSNVEATITLDEVTVSKNKAGAYGGGIYNYGETSGFNSGNSCTNTSTTNATITLVNSTISRNEAQYGGGLTNYGTTNSYTTGRYSRAYSYNYTKTNIISSTIQGNIVTGTDAKGGGVYTYSNATATSSGDYSSSFRTGTNVLDTINSIIYANYNNTNSDDLYFDGDRAKTYNNAYTIYGTSNQGLSNASSQWVAMPTEITESVLKRIFENVTQDGSGRWVSDVGISSPINTEGDRTIEINKDGLAARKGTMVGKDGEGNYYFYKKYLDSKQWTSFTNETTYDFDDNDHVYDPNFSFGLPAGSQIIRFAQNEYTDQNYGIIGDNVLRISRDINDPTK